MDEKEGFLLIGVSSIILSAFVLSIFAIMFIYRKRKLEHAKEVKTMNEHFAKELLTTQLEVQQQTMQYIGREIHDNVGQKLTLAALYAQQLEYEKLYPQISERIAAVGNIINESLSELRSLAKNLTSDYIAETDLITLIRNECDKINATGVCLVNFTTTVQHTNAFYNVRNVVTRIVQEFIQNSLKHGACSLIKINIDNTNEGLTIHAADNGKGFEENETAGKGIGLINIKKRAEAIGASVTIESKLGSGTAMQLFIPSDRINL